MVSRSERIQRRFRDEGDCIIELTRSFNKTIDWLFQNALLKRNTSCPKCLSEMSSKSDKSQFDNFYFLCENCFTKKSIRFRTIFEDSRLTLVESVRLIFHYFIEKKTLRETSAELGVCKSTIIKINHQLQRTISDYVYGTYYCHQLGEVSLIIDEGRNENGVVEVDETLFCHIEGTQIWVFGILDRATREARAFVVKDRSSETLLTLIKEHVKPEVVVYSDGWQGYSRLEELGFDHRKVNHSQTFGEGQDTTNNIENYWKHLKEITHQSSGVQPGKEDPWNRVQEIINEGIWRLRFHSEELKDELVHIINCLYF
ncbi:MAG TPA: IS1595 family transposase [Candidatus Dojkabacteria bacterium]|nr:IS1595 family transposase [Candidatus Dojkabacteria bacterium]